MNISDLPELISKINQEMWSVLYISSMVVLYIKLLSYMTYNVHCDLPKNLSLTFTSIFSSW